MSKERITISIDQNLLKKIDQQVDGMKIRNRSHAFECFISSALGLDNIKDAIVMAGGKDALKNIHDIKDALLRLKKFGVSEVIVAVGYLADKIKKELGGGKEFGLKLSFLASGEGTGGSLFLLKKAIKKTFIVVNLDHLINADYEMLFDFHTTSDKVVTIATDNIDSYKGVYIIEPTVFNYMKKGFSMLEEDVFPQLLKENNLAIFPVIK